MSVICNNLEGYHLSNTCQEGLKSFIRLIVIRTSFYVVAVCCRGAQIVQQSGSHYKILSAMRVTCSKFHTDYVPLYKL